LLAPASSSGAPAQPDPTPARRGENNTPTPAPAPGPATAGRLMRTAAALLLIAGAIALTEALLTLAWQEPITAFFAHRDQQALQDQLERTRLALQSVAPPARLHRDQTRSQHVAALAARLDRRTGPGDALGRIHIPKLDIKFVFVAGAGPKSLKKGPGHYQSTALPGQKGTVGVAGHRTTYLAPFRKLDRLRRGDKIALIMPYGRFAYTVKTSLVVSPSRISVLRQTGHDRLVLTTCTPPFSAAKRLVIIATKEPKPRHAAAAVAVRDPFPYPFRP
jgi:sortase A